MSFPEIERRMLPKHGNYHETALRGVDQYRADAIRISHALHKHPEVGLQEHWACGFLTDEARSGGFQVETPVAGMDTAFIARYPSLIDGPRVAFLCEYDALPGLGHGCGHNIIAAASFGAAMAMRPIVSELGGEILLIGTPDEEAVSDDSKGGKVVMCRAGTFEGLDAVLMMHPLGGVNQAWGYTFPLKDFTVSYEGKPAHYTEPEKGINALESLLLFLSNVNTLKRGWSPSVMFAYTITDGGGPSAITVPASAKAHITMKAFYSEYLESRFEQVKACVDAVSAMTGAKGRVTVLDEYRNAVPSLYLAASLYRNLKSLGVPVGDPRDVQRALERRTYPGLSTDFADVSWEVPAIHGYCSIGDDSLVAHTPEFVRAAASEAGDRAVEVAAKAMALSAVDMLVDSKFASGTMREFLQYKDRGFLGVPGIPPEYTPFPEEFLDALGE